MLIVTKQGEKILFDRLDDLRGYVDDNILKSIEEYIENKIAEAMDNRKIEDYVAEIDDLKEDLETRDRIESSARMQLHSVIENIREIMDDLDL